MNEYETKYFPCSCGCGGLAVSFFDDDCDDVVYFSMFDIRMKTNLLWRFKHAWHCIRYGHPHLDDVVLKEEKAWDLCNYIQRTKLRKRRVSVASRDETDKGTDAE